jgi:hypothetical protein
MTRVRVIKACVQAPAARPFAWRTFIGCCSRHIGSRNTPTTNDADECPLQFATDPLATSKTRFRPATMPHQLQPQQLLTPVPSDIAISDAIAPLPITEIAEAAGIVRIVDYCKILSSIAGGTGALH